MSVHKTAALSEYLVILHISSRHMQEYAFKSGHDYFLLYLHLFIHEYLCQSLIYEGWNFHSGNYLFTTDTK